MPEITPEMVDRAARVLYEWEWGEPAPSGYIGGNRLDWAERVLRAAFREDLAKEDSDAGS